MPRNLGLPLLEDFNEVADADLPSGHQVEEPQPGRVSERREEPRQVEGFGTPGHAAIICALTNI